MQILYLISVWLHIISSIIWVGGMFFLILVLIPVLRDPEYESIFSRLFLKIGQRFRNVGWISLCLLVLTGIINLAFRGYDFSDFLSGRIFVGTFGHVLLQKLVAVVLILLISIVHDFWIGPRAMALIRREPKSPESRKYRLITVWLGRLNFVLAILVVALAVVLVRGGI
ncbi:MAG: CopD family protein [Deltaproteobacteria bacterium]